MVLPCGSGSNKQIHFEFRTDLISRTKRCCLDLHENFVWGPRAGIIRYNLVCVFMHVCIYTSHVTLDVVIIWLYPPVCKDICVGIHISLYIYIYFDYFVLLVRLHNINSIHYEWPSHRLHCLAQSACALGQAAGCK